MSTAPRRAPYSNDEIARIVKDREKHPEMTTLAWCQQYPISEQVYYYLKRRLEGKVGKGKTKVKTKPKLKTKRKTKAKTTNTTTAFAHAVGQIKFWRAEATKLAEQLIQESLTE